MRSSTFSLNDASRSLAEGDQEAFGAALAAMVDRYEVRYEAATEEESLPEVELLTEGKVFVEGLALLRLAERAGLELQVEYPFLPRVARPDGPQTFAADAWLVPG